MSHFNFCKDFQWFASKDGGRLVTPLRYDDGDQVVVFAKRRGSGWRLDDNGEGLFRLSAAGVDPESERVQARLSAFPLLLGVSVDEDGECLYAEADHSEFERTASAVAEASSQVQALSVLRRERQTSDFRDRVIRVVQDAATSAGVESRCNVPADESKTLYVDVYVCSRTPLLVIAATTPKRLMEAEIIWLDAARRKSPVYVLAAVESAREIGLSQYTRANYYTDKTVEFTAPTALGELVAARLHH
ncbi:DUF1828 domain-containing protein [Thiocapsa rosea]|uniref:Uncharacterized protein DUF1828 n=1 Tax=Thiocapsa rosea TaxID=69360 RepID=A0A495VBT8_9GAMM|nr:DUF1828 domain-containing protein [Thiocapsa rosea]RKT46802.1 uncharacterized protein DUF1828 [Thiocapsa rosea]